MPGPHDFFGEGSLVNQSLRISTAETLEASTVFRIEKRAMIRSFHEQSEFSEHFMASLLTRYIDLEEELCDQAFQSQREPAGRVFSRSLDASVPVLSTRPGRNGWQIAHALHEQIRNYGTDRLQRSTHNKDRTVD